MSLSLYDSQNLSAAIKKARLKKHLTQAACAELLDHSLSFQKDIERGRFSPSLDNFYQICRKLNISADACIFTDTHDSVCQELTRLMTRCDDKQLRVLLATANALLEENEVALPDPKNDAQ